MRTVKLWMLGSAAVLLACWGLRSEDREGVEPPRTFVREQAIWEWQCRIIVDRPPLKTIVAGGVTIPTKGRVALLVAVPEGSEAAGLIEAAKAVASATPGVDAAWAAADEATAGKIRERAGLPGAVGPEACALVPDGTGAALFVVDQDGRVCFAHRGAVRADDPVLRNEIAWLRRSADAQAPLVVAPAPGASISGALACAACHRPQFVDWLLTPHSDALRSLFEIGREEDPSCQSCHVTGWGREDGFRALDRNRDLADVQCASCHDPERTHAGGKKLRTEEYAAQCRACHTATASILPDVGMAVPSVSHGSARSAEKILWKDRQEAIRLFREQTYFQFCSRTAYVGSAACKSCHEEPHRQWASTSHARAFETLREAGKDTAANCTRCHTTGTGHEGGFQDAKSTPAVAEVGCESCHGPGKLHLGSKTREEFLGSIFRFDEKCPSCVIHRICRSCHDSENDPEFNLNRALERVRHRAK